LVRSRRFLSIGYRRSICSVSSSPQERQESRVLCATGPQTEIILDIGSNIGASVIYFHHQFPEAKIFGFEPHPDNFRILQKNVDHLPSVTVFNYGLGATNQRIAVPADQVNFGAFSTDGRFKDRGHPAAPVECEVRPLDDVFREIGIAQVDLIKIDCEGAEADVFSTLPDEILNHCQWIVGEFHDHTGFGVLARLASHFHLDLKKKMFRSRFQFSRMQPQQSAGAVSLRSRCVAALSLGEMGSTRFGIHFAAH